MTASLSKTSQLAAISVLRQWRPATWADYVALRDASAQDLNLERMRLFFDQGWVWVDMGGEGINHSSISDLFTMLFAFWALQKPEEIYSTFGRCLLEKPETRACVPDLVLYVGADYPQWRSGQPRRIDLSQWRSPNLVGEIADTTLASDLDEKKHLYAALGIAEYWVINVQGRQAFAFQLVEGKYEICTHSRVLTGLPIALLERTIDRLTEETNISAASWFAQQIAQI